jgi:hypothetical protein
MRYEWRVTCPRCGRDSIRTAIVPDGRPQPACQHEYHAPEDCGVCGECRTGVVIK